MLGKQNTETLDYMPFSLLGYQAHGMRTHHSKEAVLDERNSLFLSKLSIQGRKEWIKLNQGRPEIKIRFAGKDAQEGKLSG